MPLAPWVATLAALTFGPPAAAPPVPAAAMGAAPALITAAAREGLRPTVLQLALSAYDRAVEHGAARGILTVIDYSLASRERRLWVLDLDGARVLAHELVAHGRRTGGDLARRFSNTPGSLQSSLGTFITGPTYEGKHGLSLRLRGLDAGLNDQAEARGIVIHGADYVNDAIVDALGRLGRSQGCPALSPSAARRVIGLIQHGTAVFAYYPTPVLERALTVG
jgi:hypothetical protein